MNIFVNKTEKRLRAGWRILIQLSGFLAVLILGGIATQLLLAGDAKEIVGAALYLVAGVAMTWLVARFIDKRRFADLGFHFSPGWWLDLAFGFLLGAGVMTGVFFSLLAAGWVSITGYYETDFAMPFAGAFASYLLIFTAVGVNEELTFRGYQLRNMAEGFSRIGRRGAVVLAFALSSTVFGLAHLANPGASLISTANIVLAGLLLGLPYILTGELAMPIGLHIAFNLFEGVVYGFAVSGSAPDTHVLTLDITGPDLWTGGAFGPEAGLMAVLWILAGCAISVIWVRLRNKHLRLHAELADYARRQA